MPDLQAAFELIADHVANTMAAHGLPGAALALGSALLIGGLLHGGRDKQRAKRNRRSAVEKTTSPGSCQVGRRSDSGLMS